MTVQATTPVKRSLYTGPGSYSFSFKVYDETDVQVFHIDSLGVIEELTYITDFSITLIPGIDGGTVVVTRPVVSGGTLEIRRQLPLTQETDWVNNSALDMELLEQSFDRVVMILQQMEVELENTVALSNWRGAWASGVSYSVRDMVIAPAGSSQENSIFVCVVDNTAGGDFDTDVIAGYWSVVIDASYFLAIQEQCEDYRDQCSVFYSDVASLAGVCATIQASISACYDIIATARDEAVASAAAALVSETAALGSADAAAISEDNAATSAEAAETSAQQASDAADVARSVSSQRLEAFGQKINSEADPVSVFIYDTSKDSDGGAWTKRCKDKSWYNESSSSTRGSRSSFPEIAGIVAYANEVRIYDLTDTSFPMWMVFEADANVKLSAVVATATNPINSVAMINGVMAVAAKGAGGALSIVNFLEDVTAVRINDTTRYYSRNIADRNINIATTEASYYSAGLVSRACNAVAMTVLDNAPVDISTGLPVPTIAVATDAGVSFIDGPAGVDTVIDIWESTNAFSDVAFLPNDRMCVHYADFGATRCGAIPSVDNSVASSWGPDLYYNTEVVNTDLYLPITTSGGKCVKTYDAGLALIGAEGAFLIKENPSSAASGMAAHITTEYNTGWMQGDTKLATLCDTTEETLGVDVTTEFLSDVDWSTTDGWESGDSGILTATGEELTVENGAATYGYALQLLSGLTEGNRYRLVSSITDLHGGGSAQIRIGSTAGGTDIGVAIETDTGPVSFDFTAEANNYLTLIIPSNNIGATRSFGPVQIFEIGDEEVVNGTFDTDITGWTESNNPSTSVSSGQVEIAYVDTANPYIYQFITTVVGQTYELSVDKVSGDTARIRVGRNIGSDEYGQILTTDNETHVITFIPTTTSTCIRIGSSISAAGSTVFDNVSVRAIPNVVENGEFSSDRVWTKSTGASISGGAASFDGSDTTQNLLSQLVTTESNTAYLFRFNISAYTSGNIAPNLTGVSGTGTLVSAAGLYEEILLSDSDGGSGVALYTDASGFNGSVDLFEVYEVELVNGTWQIVDQVVANPRYNGILDTAEWTAVNDSLLVMDDAELKVVNGAANYGRASQALSGLELGQVYNISIDFTKTTDNARIRVGTSASGNETLQVQPTASGTYTISFRATASTLYLNFGTQNNTLGYETTWDNVSIKRLNNLVDNGEFSSDRAWIKDTGWTISSGVANCDGSQTGNSYLTQTLGTLSASKYHVKFDLTRTAGNAALILASSTGSYYAETGINATGSYEYIIDFSTGSGYTPSVLQIMGDLNFVGTVDNVEVYELDVEDRSAQGNPLRVVGELDFEPVATGAELCGVSGFSADNYLEQSYNDELDYGTGDFYYKFWFTNNGSAGSLLNKRLADSSGSNHYVLIASDVIQWRALSSGDAQLASTTSVDDGRWHMATIVRRSGVGEIYLDGKLDMTPASQSQDVDITDAIFVIGNRVDGGSPCDGSIALFSTGASAPSAGQIEMVYNEEKHLFEEGASCTLIGSDDTVVDLSYNERTDEIVAATAEAVTLVKGLRTTEMELEDVDGLVPVSFLGDASRSGNDFTLTGSADRVYLDLTNLNKGEGVTVYNTLVVENTGATVPLVLRTTVGGTVYQLPVTPGETAYQTTADASLAEIKHLYGPVSATFTVSFDLSAVPGAVIPVGGFFPPEGNIVAAVYKGNLKMIGYDTEAYALSDQYDLRAEIEKRDEALALLQGPPLEIISSSTTDHVVPRGFYPVSVYGVSGSYLAKSAYTLSYDGFQYHVGLGASAALILVCRRIQ